MKVLKVIAVLVPLSLSAMVHAGYTQPAPVDVDLDIQFAGGDMMTARWSKGNETLIGCGIRVFDTGAGAFKFGFCQATDADGEAGFCSTESPELIAAISGMSDYAYVSFSWNDDEECMRVGTSTQSFYLNKDNPSFVNKNSNQTP